MRIGLATCDTMQMVATPLETLPTAADDAAVASDLAATVEREGMVAAVVGYPRTLEGREGRAAARARRIATALQDEAGCPVILWDERFTTVEAERIMLEQDASRRERRQHIDRVAATLILQTVLDARTGGVR